jgi:hypothetical protein
LQSQLGEYASRLSINPSCNGGAEPIPKALGNSTSQLVGNIHLGRYDFLGRDNFNRGWPDLSEAVAERVGERLASVRSIVDLAGLPMLSLLGAFDGHPDPESLWLRPWDRHPTVEGHRLLADDWLAQWARHPDLADLVLGADRAQLGSVPEPSGDASDDR